MPMRLRAVVIASSDMRSPARMAPRLRAIEASWLPGDQRRPKPHPPWASPPSCTRNVAATTQSVRHLICPRAQADRLCGQASAARPSAPSVSAATRSLSPRPASLPDPDLAFDVSFRFAAGRDAVARALQRGIRIDGLQAGSDEIAMGAIAALQDHKLRVPEDVAVVGFGNVEFAAHMRPSVTTLSSHPDLAAQHLREILRCLDEEREVPRLHVVSRSLIRRQSG